MLNTILRLIPQGNPKAIPNWERYIMLTKLRLDIMKTRFLNSPFQYNTGMQMLIQILDIAQANGLCYPMSDYKKYSEIIDPLLPAIRPLFDPVYSTRNNINIFSTGVPQFLMNVSMDTPLMSLPLEQSWNKWKDLAPIRIIYHDAKQLVSNLMLFKINFKGPKPSRLFISIDLTLLLFKYMKYIEYMKSIGKNYSKQEFIQHYVISHWFDDLLRIWLFNILQQVMNNTFKQQQFIADPMVSPKGLVQNIIQDIYLILDQAKKKVITVNDICATKWFGDYSLSQWLNYLNKYIQVPILRAYKYLQFTSTYQYVIFILNMLHMINRRETVLIIRYLLFDLRIWYNERIWNTISNAKLRDSIQEEMRYMISKIANMLPL